ncbi:MAG: diguanylate cyclase [Planctomycetaceae bacterium]|nr:diguanylate cyclase [Planctomycetaceae bacterium]
MKRLSTTFRLAFCLSSLVVTALLSAHALGLLPDAHSTAVQGRVDLCEAIAIHFSELAEKSDIEGMQRTLKAIASRNEDIVSIGVRRTSGEMLIEVGDHVSGWNSTLEDRSTSTQMYVPIAQENRPWGSIELRFRPLHSSGIAGFLAHPLVKLAFFLALVTLLAFQLYLRFVLRQLNPSKVVPSRVRSALDSITEGLMLLDPRGRIVMANESFLQASGQSLEKLLGRSAADLPWRMQEHDNPERHQSPWGDVLRDGVPRKGTLMSLKSQSDRTYVVNAAPIVDDNGNQRGVITSFEDVTEMRNKESQLEEALRQSQADREEIHRQNQELERLATRDPLTGCRNRRAFFDLFEQSWSESLRHQDELSCVMVDVDKFKSINDNHGHAVGDEVLKKVAHCLMKTARDSDIVCRYGGEEFAILMPRTGIHDANFGAERFRLAIAALEFPELTVTASLGVSALSENPDSPQELLDQADKCLYYAKRNGRNQVASFDKIPKEALKPEKADSENVPGPRSGTIPYPAVTALTSALAYRDVATANHCRRVADLAAAVGDGLLTAGNCYILEIAALLHDIGKIGVPDSILHKQSPLTEEEWKLMKGHERVGLSILRTSFGSPELSDIVENYRRPFSEHNPIGQGIPLGARILAVADAYDAMMTPKVYRDGLSQQDAFEQLREEAGKQYDPEIVERLINVVQIRRINQDIPLHVARETALLIGMELEQFSVLMERQDLQGLHGMAGRIAQVCHQEGVPEIATKAMELEQATTNDENIFEALKCANELLNYCRASQAVVLQTEESVSSGGR